MKNLIWLNRIEGAIDNGGGTSASITLPADTGAAAAVKPDAAAAAAKPDAAAATPPAFAIPDAYKDKLYLKGVDSPDKLFKMLDGAQELIGKKGATLPAADAPVEEWDKYYESIGRPKTSDEYAFEPVEGLKYDEKLTKGVKDLMHKNGLTAAQAKNIQKGFDNLVSEVAKEKGIALQQQDVDFDKLAADSFGAQRDTILATSKSLIDKFTSAGMKTHVANLPNEALVVLADVMNNINKTYIKQDAPIGNGPTVTGLTPAQVSSKGRELMASEAYTNPWHKDHATVVKQVQDLYKPAPR